MNVTCGRCGTSYEFETALLSRRGAVVRCTQCQFEFRVRLPGSVVAERWIVRRASGEEYEFESEIELTDAQSRGVLGEFDEVSKDGIHFVPLAERASLDVHTSTPPLALRRRSRPPLAHESSPYAEPAPLPAMRRPAPVTSYPPVSQTGTGSRWIVGFVLIGAGALLSATVGRDYLAGAQAVREAATTDARTREWLSAGESFLVDGDLQRARAEFERVIAASDSDPGALLGLVRIELQQVDVAWLARFFLRATSDAKQASVVEAEFDARQLRLKAAIDVLRSRAAGLAEAQLYLADALRIQGDVAAARRLLPQVVQPVSHPDVAYTLALLDLAEAGNNFEPIVARLATVAAAERRPGRATAAHIYALAAAGQREEAHRRYTALSKPEPELLWSALASYLASSNSAPVEVASAALPAADVSATAAPSNVAASSAAALNSAAPRGQKYSSQENTLTGGSYPEAITLAGRARAVHDYELASRHYSQALSHNPGSVEAMVGLGDMAKLQGKLAIAISHYSAALRQNPRSELALRALGDLRWETGERAVANELYESMVPSQRGAQVVARMREWQATRRPEGASPAAGRGSLTGETDGLPNAAGNSQESP